MDAVYATTSSIEQDFFYDQEFSVFSVCILSILIMLVFSNFYDAIEEMEEQETSLIQEYLSWDQNNRNNYGSFDQNVVDVDTTSFTAIRMAMSEV